MLFARCRGRWPLRAGAVGPRQRASQRRRGGRSRADPVWGRVDLCADAAGEKVSPVAVAPCSAGATAQFGPFPVAKAAAALWGGGGALCRPDDVCQLPAAPLEGRTLPAKGAGRSPVSGDEWSPPSSRASQRRVTAAERGGIVWQGASAPTAAGGKGPLLPANGAWPVGGAALPEGRGWPQRPFFACLKRPSRSIRAEIGAAAHRLFPPSRRGERRPFRAGAFRRAPQGRVRGRSALCTPGAAPQKGGRLPLPSG